MGRAPWGVRWFVPKSHHPTSWARGQKDTRGACCRCRASKLCSCGPSTCQRACSRLALVLERRLMQVVNDMQQNQARTAEKKNQEATAWREYRREQLMHLKKLELGKIMFGKWQKTILKWAFFGWVKYWMWRMSCKTAYKMKYGLEKHERDLYRLAPELEAKYEREVRGGDLRDVVEDRHPTILKTHQRRLLQDRLNGATYTEESNNSSASAYHPGKYEMACPRNCKYCDVDGMPTHQGHGSEATNS